MVKEVIKKFISDVCHFGFSDNTEFEKLCLDSFDKIDILMNVERYYDITIPLDAVDDVVTVKDFEHIVLGAIEFKNGRQQLS